MDYVWIGIGAAAGANSRYLVGQAVAQRLGTDFPYGTLLVNVSGSFVIGLLMVLLSDRFLVDPHWRLLLVVGVLGGYTTFSSFSYETISLAEQGRWLATGAYTLGSVSLSLAACYGGVVVARLVER